MQEKTSKQIVDVLATIVILGALIIMIGWIFNIEILKTLNPNWISTKFNTALSFFMSGILLLQLNRQIHSKNSGINVFSIIFLSTFILFLMFCMFITMYFNIPLGIESFFLKDLEKSPTFYAGMPSISTFASFFIVVLLSLTTIFDGFPNFFIGGAAIVIISAIALAGYAFNIPAMYYYFPNFTNPIAFNTAALFVLLGTGFIFLQQHTNSQKLHILKSNEVPQSIIKFNSMMLLILILSTILFARMYLELFETSKLEYNAISIEHARLQQEINILKKVQVEHLKEDSPSAAFLQKNDDELLQLKTPK